MGWYHEQLHELISMEFPYLGWASWAMAWEDTQK